MSKLANFDAMNNAMPNNKVMIITHPRKTGHARIVVKYPKDGAGRLQVWLADYFGANGCEGVQYGFAGGYGYDKLTAALSGFKIDGHALTDHCGQDAKSKKYLRDYAKAGTKEAKDKIEARAKKAGYSWNNWGSVGGYCPTGSEGWQSLYKLSGLDYLTALGYRVITVG